MGLLTNSPGQVAREGSRGHLQISHIDGNLCPVERVSADGASGSERGNQVNEGLGSNEQRVRQILVDHGNLSGDVNGLGVGDDLYAAGMSSRASVSVMLAIEAAFEIEFPDAMLRRDVFASIASMCAAIDQIRDGR